MVVRLATVMPGVRRSRPATSIDTAQDWREDWLLAEVIRRRTNGSSAPSPARIRVAVGRAGLRRDSSDQVFAAGQGGLYENGVIHEADVRDAHSLLEIAMPGRNAAEWVVQGGHV
jgi:hypothetical protein